MNSSYTDDFRNKVAKLLNKELKDEKITLNRKRYL